MYKNMHFFNKSSSQETVFKYFFLAKRTSKFPTYLFNLDCETFKNRFHHLN